MIISMTTFYKGSSIRLWERFVEYFVRCSFSIYKRLNYDFAPDDEWLMNGRIIHQFSASCASLPLCCQRFEMHSDVVVVVVVVYVVVYVLLFMFYLCFVVRITILLRF